MRMDDDASARLTALEARVRILEDHVALYQLMMGYGPAVDAGECDLAAARWTEDGVYDAQVGAWHGRDAIAGMVQGEMHQDIIRGGSAHITAMPYIAVDGDHAVATAYAQLCRATGDGFRVWRVTATRWEFVRSGGAWLVQRRVNRLLDGDPEARELLRQGVITGSIATSNESPEPGGGTDGI
jgi:SnoaL-like domain